MTDDEYTLSFYSEAVEICAAWTALYPELAMQFGGRDDFSRLAHSIDQLRRLTYP